MSRVSDPRRKRYAYVKGAEQSGDLMMLCPEYKGKGSC